MSFGLDVTESMSFGLPHQTVYDILLCDFTENFASTRSQNHRTLRRGRYRAVGRSTAFQVMASQMGLFLLAWVIYVVISREIHSVAFNIWWIDFIGYHILLYVFMYCLEWILSNQDDILSGTRLNQDELPE